MLPRSPLTVILLWATVAPVWSFAQEARFEAWTVDGERLSGQKVTGNHEPAGAPQLDGRTLLTADGNSARALCDLSLSGELAGPYVQFTNGDCVPGQLVWRTSADAPQLASQLALQIAATGRDDDWQAATLLVRESMVGGVGFAPEHVPIAPGKVILTDGRSYTARAIRCDAEGLHCLTADGVQVVGYHELRAARFPHRDKIADLLAQSAFASADNRATLLRMKMASGGTVTAPRSMVKRINNQRILVRPAWSYESFSLHRDRIAWHTWWRHHELPLSFLPVEWRRTAQGLHAWPARLNANLHGRGLRSAALGAETGLGMPAGMQGSFALPPGSVKFSAWVGIDRAAGAGGCAQVKVYRDAIRGEPAWQSRFLRGGEPPVRVGPIDLNGATQLVLVTDWAHAGRPAGTDPFDIRDYVDWLHPFVEFDAGQLPAAAGDLGAWIPELAGWQVPAKHLSRVQLRPTWAKESWQVALVVDPQGSALDAEPVELVRRMKITLANARVVAGFGHDGTESQHFKLLVLVDGQEVASTMNGPPNSGARPGLQGSFDFREYSLADFVNKDVTLTLRLQPNDAKAARRAGLLWGRTEFLPLIEGLPPNLEPLRPSVPLTSLELKGARPGFDLKPGLTSEGQPLAVRGYRLSDGFGVPTGAAVTCDLQPRFTRFVAVVGLAGGWQGVGPYAILLDGKPYWQLDRKLDRNSPGIQIDVPIPPGHKTITFTVEGRECQAAWGHAGFLE